MAEIWFYAWAITYILLIAVCYNAYVSKIVKAFRYPGWYYHYHILDTGESGDFVFKEGENRINGVSRIFARDRIFKGTVFYEEGNAEPLKIERDLIKYKYYCDTKNFDTVARNDILETLLVLRAKDFIVMLIIIGVVVTVLAVGVSFYITHTSLQSVSSGIDVIINQTRPSVWGK